MRPRPYSNTYSTVILAQYQAWQNGISPTSKPRGYEGQNPHLLQAFDAIARGIDSAASPTPKR